MSKKAYIALFVVVLSQAVYTTYLVRENVRHERQMREQQAALLEQFFQLSKDNRNTTIPQPAAQPVQTVSSDENVSHREIERSDPLDDTPQINHLLDMAKEYEEAGSYEDAYLLSLKALEIDPDNQRAQWVSYKMKQAMDRDKEYTQLARSASQSVKRSANRRTKTPRQKKSSQKESSLMDEDEPRHLHGNTTTYIGVSPDYSPPPKNVYYSGGDKKNTVSSDIQHRFLIDSFDKQGNEMGGRSSTYVKEPSGIFAGKDGNIKHGDSGKSLKLRYKKESQGGPFGKGGWCGYYIILKSGPRKYFNVSRYNYLTFWVKGAEGGENFKIGVADEAQEQREDSVKTEEIAVYLPDGKITTEWQQARIPLDEVFVDLSKLASIAICFSGDCFPDGSGKGTVYIDDMYFE